MGISYNVAAKKWNVSYEKTDYDTSRPTSQTVTIGVYPTVTPAAGVEYQYAEQLKKQAKPTTLTVVLNPKGNLEDDSLEHVRAKIQSAISTLPKEVSTLIPVKPVFGQPTGKNEAKGAVSWSWGPVVNEFNLGSSGPGTAAFIRQKDELRENFKTIVNTVTYNDDLNRKYAYDNKINQARNNIYDAVQIVAQNTAGGDYKQKRDAIRSLASNPLYATVPFVQNVIQDAEKSFRNFYAAEKLKPWDSNLGAKPLYGDFDPDYYKAQNPQLTDEWKRAVQEDDLDIIGRYTNENSFYLQHYTNVGKPAGQRGNRPEFTAAAGRYVERAPKETDKDFQDVRTQQLGVDVPELSQTERLLGIPEIATEWEKAKTGDPYWKQLAKEKFLDVDKKDDFIALFRLSDRTQDQQTRLNYNVNTGYGISELEDAINEAAGERIGVDVKKFAALTQDALKTTIEEMKKAKIKEQQLSMYKSIDSVSEILDISKELTNSILGDTGVGGILSFTSGNKAEESLEKSLQEITGINNNVTYNWQQWFDTQLKTRYDKDLELGYGEGQAKENIKIEADFAKNFINTYLTPRFNTSRSMDEFVEYMDVRQEEQNPFQTQDLLNAVKQLAEIKANSYLKDILSTPDRFFDPEFYFNPTDNKGRAEPYSKQAEMVNADWEKAKAGDPYWKAQAYRFGLDLNNKADFAKLHFEVRGQARGFDAAPDIINPGKISDEIFYKILPALEGRVEELGTVFGEFRLPEEFADKMLKGLNPNDKTTWNDVLEKYGLKDFKGTIEELRDYIIEAFRTGTAQEIREQIKYLNERREKPTQDILGVTYIQREEDYKKNQPTSDTQLYKIFQSAGYEGTEDEFYENFFPDVDRSEQIALTKAGRGEALQMEELKFGDPFESLSTIESFFDTDEEEEDAVKFDTSDEEDKPSYFRIGLDDDIPDKSEAGKGFLDEFTSMFKGFSF